MTYEELKREVRSANLVLVGLGEELSGDMASFYKALAELLEKKDYFIVSLSGKRRELEEAGLLAEQITLPLAEGEEQKAGRTTFTGFLLH